MIESPISVVFDQAENACTRTWRLDALGNADEGKPVQPNTVEAWARDPKNPVRGYYGLRKGYRGRFANYVTPVLELLGRVELEHLPRNNRVRFLAK